MRGHLSPTIVEIKCKTCSVTIRHNYRLNQYCRCPFKTSTWIGIDRFKQFLYADDAKFIKFFDLKLSPPVTE